MGRIKFVIRPYDYSGSEIDDYSDSEQSEIDSKNNVEFDKTDEDKESNKWVYVFMYIDF